MEVNEVNQKNDYKNLIMEYIDEAECEFMCDDKAFDCDNCSNFEMCCQTVGMRCDEDLNDIFAESINYGGYDSAEDFWEQLLE